MANGVPKALPESSSGRSPLPATSGPGPAARPGDGSEVDSTEPTFIQVTVGGADSELEEHGMTRS